MKKIAAMAVESFWRNRLVEWLLYIWDLDKGSGQGLVKVFGFKDLR